MLSKTPPSERITFPVRRTDQRARLTLPVATVLRVSRCRNVAPAATFMAMRAVLLPRGGYSWFRMKAHQNSRTSAKVDHLTYTDNQKSITRDGHES
jgi:hypothetical protein